MKGRGNRKTSLTYAGHKMNGYLLPHSELAKGKELVITTMELVITSK